MLRHDSNNVIVFNNNNGPASTKSFFNGSYNTMMLDFDPLVSAIHSLSGSLFLLGLLRLSLTSKL